MVDQSIVTKVLLDAAGLVEKGWCQNDFAKNADGYSVSPRDPSACVFCAAGAITHAAVTHAAALYVGPGHAARQELIRVIGTDNVAIWNDTPSRTSEDVVTALRSAAVLSALAENKEETNG